jgi:hypothetical protein
LQTGFQEKKSQNFRLKTPQNTRKNSTHFLQGYASAISPLNFPSRGVGGPIVCVDFRWQLISET